ncbi:MAG: Heme/hemopexin transporter protein HuxB [Candidatus Anoxychlamydiales bacterium]|nr:Heme/hemopexin transporter protein HuxB [Candidatus Anoxychlamydiales bacterium]
MIAKRTTIHINMNKFFWIFVSLLSFIFINAIDAFENQPTHHKRILVERLNTLIFQDHYHEISKTNSAIIIDGVDIPKVEQFKKQLQEKFIGTQVSLEKLSEIKFFTINYFREKGYPLVGVNIPAGQDITDGEVYFIVQVARLNEIEVQGARYFSEKRIKNQVRLKSGEEIKTNKLIEDLEWLNDNPFRNVNAIYTAADKLNETNIILNVEDRFPLRVYAGYENSSYVIAGSSRFIAGFNYGNFLKLDQQINFQFMSALEFNDFWGVAGTYIIPLPWKNILKFLGSYSRAVSDEKPFQVLTGKGWTFASRYEVPLPIVYNLSHDVIFGFDFKRTNNFLAYADNLVFNKFIDIFQLLLKYQGTKDDSLGVTSFEFSVFYSPGGFTKNNKTSKFQQEREGAKSNYVYLDLDIERITRLKRNFSWVVNFLGQLSFSKLILSEQLALGGNFTVRGYMENEVSGDSGFLLKNELRFPNIFSKKNNNFKRVLQFLAFVDYGLSVDVDKNLLSKNPKSLLSIGPGVRYNMSTYLTFRFDYGFQLIDVKNRSFQNSGNSRGHLNVVAAY